MSAIDEQVGTRVHMLMWQQRVTQSAVGTALGIDQSGVSKKLRGKRPWLAADIVTLAQLLGVTTSDLLADAASPSTPPPAPTIPAVTEPTSSATSARHRAADRWSMQVNPGGADGDRELLPTG